MHRGVASRAPDIPLLLPVLFSMSLSRRLRLIPSLSSVASSRMGVVGSLFVLAAVVVLGSFAVMARGVAMMFRCLPMMFRRFFRHVYAFFLNSPQRNVGSPIGFRR
jgi:hypothetical protein